MKKLRWNICLLLFVTGICFFLLTACTGGSGENENTKPSAESTKLPMEMPDGSSGVTGSPNDLPILWE